MGNVANNKAAEKAKADRNIGEERMSGMRGE